MTEDLELAVEKQILFAGEKRMYGGSYERLRSSEKNLKWEYFLSEIKMAGPFTQTEKDSP